MVRMKEPGVVPGMFGDSVKFVLLPPGTMMVGKLILTGPVKPILKNKLPHFHSWPHTLKQFRTIKESNFNCDLGKHILQTKTKIIIETKTCSKSKGNIYYLILVNHSFLFKKALEYCHGD